ncbi:ATP-dependent DNA helicase DinG [Oikeobacillus pervagus]|uniref:3'-5' exonuclease DinG n=1 Tax=Oikeobacillus pervagus TaxID=1325931 RepID=A0AAJ1SYP6_9BACI|nr:ATP-dependent DNA helicase DinG [Oikeobacillus pervagus]MDQ0213667.1 ATP-dependent DNA helicase DinG [Oikeobacillus pervagus]
MSHLRFVVVDLETTGNSPQKGDRIIQASFVMVEDGKIMDQYTTFINPGFEIPVFIQELTGITNEMVTAAPSFIEVAPKFLQLLENAVFVAHNVPFDFTFLQDEFERVGFPAIHNDTVDTVELAKIMFPTADSYKLSDLTEHFEFPHDRPHQADSDAYVTAKLLLLMIEEMDALPVVTLEKLLNFSYHLKSDIFKLFQLKLAEKERKVEHLSADLEIYQGIALRKKQIKKREYSINPPFFPLEREEKKRLLQQLKDYEERDSQIRMMDLVNESFHLATHGVIEAGTGIGKTLAYLLPALYFSKEKKTTIMISTYTTVLQEQLLQKELKQLQTIIPFPFQVAVLKGRSHYIDLRKFEKSLHELGNYDTIMAKMQILVWLTQTVTGDVDELHLSSGGEHYWHQIKQKESYLNKSHLFREEKDFYRCSRLQAEEADVVITNHSLLVLDLCSEKQLLPPYEYVIIDEAHQFDRTVRDYIGLTFEEHYFKRIYQRLGLYEQNKLLFQCEKLLKKYGEKPNVPIYIVNEKMTQLGFECEELFIFAQAFLKKFSVTKGPASRIVQLRLTDQERKHRNWKQVQYTAERVFQMMKDIWMEMDDRLVRLKKHEKKCTVDDQLRIEQLFSAMKEWKELSESIRNILIQPNQDEVYWMEGDIRSLSNTFKIISQPIESGTFLKNRLYPNKTVIFTSATLTVNHSFQYFVQNIGLQGLSYKTDTFCSPYDYKEHCRLYIPNDVPEVNQVSLSEYVEVLANHLISIAEATKGRMLILFTSYEMLKNTYHLMNDSGMLEDFVLLAQGITSGSKYRLTKNFQKFEKAILFGTNSFWEGVDIRGEDLSCLVMVRLPFTSPNEPYLAAKTEQLQRVGKSSFFAYSLPQAVLRFKQGFGRLIRSADDRGIIIVFDRRIMTSSYGKMFLKSIPEVPIHHSSLDEMIVDIEKWL